MAVHHAWNRGIERCDIFRDDDDRRNFLARIERSLRDRHLAIYAWALMPNHFHLLTRTGNLGLSATMSARQLGMLVGIHPSTALRNAAAGESVIAKLGLSSRQILPEADHPF